MHRAARMIGNKQSKVKSRNIAMSDHDVTKWLPTP